ncbi:MAG: tRNA pseudouridine(55) synthase TruB [Bacteroidota bacterium]
MEDVIASGRVILIDKPYSWTSFNVVGKLKAIIRYKTGVKKFKIGHAGTLDPLATGLLIVCIGKKTKEIEQFQMLTKEYTGIIRLGSTTPSYDLEKEIDFHFPTDHITPELINSLALEFLGDQMQVPPIYSAVKINGKRAFSYARNGEEVEIKSKLITISKFEINKIDQLDIHFTIQCSKGTYIRSIARDFGLRLNSGAHLIELRRTKIGIFDVLQAFSPEDELNILTKLQLNC